MKQVYSIVILLLLFACNKNEDLLQDSEFGSVKYDEFKTQMIDKGLFIEPNEDSTSFRYYIIKDGIKYETEASFNTGKYKFGKLRDIFINLNSDTFYLHGRTYQFRGSGPRLKNEVHQIYELYNDWYGEPDTLEVKYPLLKPTGDLFSPESTRRLLGKKVDSSGVPERTAIWKRDNFTISFFLPFPEVEPNLDSALVYNHASIKYKMINYDHELNRIKDSIRKSLTPKDLITMNVYQPTWRDLNSRALSDYDSQIEFNIRDIQRKDLEEPRGVTGVRFDIVILDKFNKELYRMEDVTYEPNTPLMNGSNGLLAYDAFPTIYTMKYFKNSKSTASLESARIYSQTNKIKVNAEIKAIVFDDGSVLESKN